jgi:hypothetical protein
VAARDCMRLVTRLLHLRSGAAPPHLGGNAGAGAEAVEALVRMVRRLTAGAASSTPDDPSVSTPRSSS